MSYYHIKDPKHGLIGVQVLNTRFFGLQTQIKVHYAETPILSRRPFWVWTWKLKKAAS